MNDVVVVAFVTRGIERIGCASPRDAFDGVGGGDDAVLLGKG